MGGGKSTDNHHVIVLLLLMWLYTTPQSYDFFLKLARISRESFEKSYFGKGYDGLGDCHYNQGL